MLVRSGPSPSSLILPKGEFAPEERTPPACPLLPELIPPGASAAVLAVAAVASAPTAAAAVALPPEGAAASGSALQDAVDEAEESVGDSASAEGTEDGCWASVVSGDGGRGCAAFCVL